MNTTRAGFWSGLLAVGPMTLVDFIIQNQLPKKERSPLPPAILTHELTGSKNPDVTMLSHLGYSLSMAGVYSVINPSAQKPVTRGALFGMAVWGLSYLGWIEAMQLRPRATNMTAKRNAMKIAAHLVWGVTLGLSYSYLRQSGNEMLQGNRKARGAE